MKKLAITAVLALAMVGTASASSNSNNSANYGEDCNNCYNTPTTNQGGAGGNGGLGGQGGSATANGGDALSIAGAASAAEAKANAAAIAAQAQKQSQDQKQNQLAVGTGGKATGGSGGNSGGNLIATDIRVAGDERNAPPVIAGNIPTVITSCRLYMFGGGTNVNGAVSGSVPLGNDQTCLSGASTANMKTTNQLFPGTYTKRDFLIVQCKVEGMSDTEACQELGK